MTNEEKLKDETITLLRRALEEIQLFTVPPPWVPVHPAIAKDLIAIEKIAEEALRTEGK